MPARTPDLRRGRLLRRAAPAALATLALALSASPARAASAGGSSAEPEPAPAAPAPAPAVEPAPAAPAAETVTIGLDPSAAGRPVPPRFLGLSFEVGSLALLGELADRGNLVTLLRSLGPGMLRFGGITADQNVAWTDSNTPRPAWATATIGPAQMHALGRLARRSGWKVLLTVGLAHFEPAAAAREVASAKAQLGSYLAAVEIGNEPDSLGRHGYRAPPWGAQTYEEEVSVYREAIGALTPGIALAGPDVSGSGAFAEWGNDEVLSQAPALLTGHHYPLGCTAKPAPSLETLLSPAMRGLEAHSLETYLSVARANAIPLRIDEANSVSCGGVAGVSNTFGSALWATGYIGQAMAAGVAGLNLHGHPLSCSGYSPLCAPDPADAASGQLHAQPDWYALLLARTLIGDRPLPTTISASGSPNLAVAGFSGPGHTLKLLLSDDDPPGSPPLLLHVGVGAGLGAGQVLRLTGSSPSATDGVRLGGRAVAADGSWTPPKRLETAPVRAGVLTVRVAPSSAALVAVAPPRRTCGRKPRRRRGGTACPRSGAARPAPPRR